MAPSCGLVGGAVEVEQPLVDEPLLGRLEADQLRADHVEHRVDGLADPLAAVALAAVAQLDRLEGAGRGTRGDRGAADGAVVEGDLDLDGGVAARVEDLARADSLDGRHDGAPAGRRGRYVHKPDQPNGAAAATAGTARPAAATGRLRGMTEHRTGPARSPYHQRLPYGERLSAAPPRPAPRSSGSRATSPPGRSSRCWCPRSPGSGELDPAECFHCRPTPEHLIWRDDQWHVGGAPLDRVAVHSRPGPERARPARPDGRGAARDVRRPGPAARRGDPVRSTGWPARTSRAGATGRRTSTCTSWRRPLGMMQGRGPMLAFWDDVLPPTDPALLAAPRAGRSPRRWPRSGGEALV